MDAHSPAAAGGGATGAAAAPDSRAAAGGALRVAAGDRDGAEDLFDAYLPLVVYEQQPGYGLAVRKEILRRRGALRCAATRAPGPRLRPADAAEIDALVGRLERRLGGR